jgi:hypothetical protein
MFGEPVHDDACIKAAAVIGTYADHEVTQRATSKRINESKQQRAHARGMCPMEL